MILFFRIIAALSQEERGLFRERIRFLDKKIHAGLTKLTWASKGISDYFVTECRMHSSKIQGIVDEYKVCTERKSGFLGADEITVDVLRLTNQPVYHKGSSLRGFLCI